jgi:hypothetical protein
MSMALGIGLGGRIGHNQNVWMAFNAELVGLEIGLGEGGVLPSLTGASSTFFERLLFMLLFTLSP